jgi:mono/diheme cytochrome c family protein
VNPSFSAGAGANLRRVALLCLLTACVGACEQKPADLRPWRASDHDHTDAPVNGQVQVDPAAAASQVVPGLEDVTIVAWQQNCVQCHGTLGRGDGPRGPMLKATNLADPTWQASATDEHIARVIKEGKGVMPAFKLPDPTILNLVKLVRMMNSAKQAAEGGASPSAVPSASAATGAARPPTPRSVGTESAKPAGSAPAAPQTAGHATPRGSGTPSGR